MPTTIAPCSLAICATTGAEPVPVPPPIPAVMKQRSAFSRSASSVGLAISAALFPTSGYPPAPRPLVRDLPMRTLLSDWIISRCCLSVLIAMVSAPETPIWCSLLMVLFPAPPQPMITIRGCPMNSSSMEPEVFDISFSISKFFWASLIILCIVDPPKP
ncbi:MAG: hypothetical protein A4E42_01524 [Methanoregulaceae archaeon PtaU1.Bin222]|nr:MAG: hypothetical protein A4E42_01524 [Methanoregulaceae archaeon PtaU1.Bin222]